MNRSLRKTLDQIEENQRDQHQSVALKYLELVCADSEPTKDKLEELDAEVNKLTAIGNKRQMVLQVATNIT